MGLLQTPSDFSFNFILSNGVTSHYNCLDIVLQPVVLPNISVQVKSITMRESEHGSVIHALRFEDAHRTILLEAGFWRHPSGVERTIEIQDGERIVGVMSSVVEEN